MAQVNFTPNCNVVLTDANITDHKFSYSTWKNADVEVKETKEGVFVNGVKAQKVQCFTDFTSMPKWPGGGSIDGLMKFLSEEFDVAIETSRPVIQRPVFGWDNTPTRYNQPDVILIKL